MESPNYFENILKYFSFETLPLENKDSEVEFTKISLIKPVKFFLQSFPELENKFNIRGDG